MIEAAEYVPLTKHLQVKEELARLLEVDLLDRCLDYGSKA